MQRRGDEDNGEGDREKSNGYFRARINTLPYLGKFITNDQGNFSWSLTPGKIKFDDINVSLFTLFMGL